MEFHPLANIFPLLSGDEYLALVEDIRQSGLLEPVWLHEGKILDGRNRYMACQTLGIEAAARQWSGEAGSPVNFVLSLNLARRHMDSSQRAACAVAALPFLEKEALGRQEATQLSGRDADGNPLFGPGNISGTESERGESRDRAAATFGTNPRYVSDAKRLADESPEIFERIRAGEITIPKAKQEVARQNKPEPTETPPLPDKRYRCIVIDPPWPIKKIEREERPNQGIALDYPIMSLDEIKSLPVGDLAHPGGCHLYLWVTQKYLPAGLGFVEHWGFRYQCLLTWRKNVGMTPFSWMYDTEHVIFARCGNLPLSRMGLRLSFDAQTRGHSIKPDVFYTDRVLPVSPEPRLDMFARRERDGFEVWGNEV